MTNITQIEISAFESDSDADPHLEHNDLPENYRNMTMYQRTIVYAIILQRFGFSNEEIATIEDMMAIVFGAHPPISELKDRSDIGSFPGYRKAIERIDEFRKGHIKLLLSVSLDGFRPRRISKREIWPLYLRVEGLPQSEANKYHNFLLAEAIYSRIKPADKMMEILFTRFESELASLRDAPLEVQLNRNTWNVEVRLYKGVADMAVPKGEAALAHDSDKSGDRRKINVKEMILRKRVRKKRSDEDPPRGTVQCDPSTYCDCVARGILNMGKAAALICKKRQEGTFNSAVYEGEINRATHLRLARTVEFTEKRQIDYGTATTNVDLNNCANIRRIKANPPFKQCKLKSLAAKWQPRKKDITDSPQAIQMYSMRMNRRSGRDEKLSNLPEHVEALLGFGEDVLGFGRKEIADETMDLTDSAFYNGLGSTEAERRQAFEKLRTQRSSWSGYLFAALQKALRGIRSYTFDVDLGWTPAKVSSFMHRL
ncbi:unnamed protein product [Cylicocyclus nassatus]|uniref:Uncharacterized protein n=1 Tax=Cylicocyclus nassatus TaxID=53992 RepID=A0AA36DQU4_CYLNA|nr:unnamed protein product [Cylicocyclus nassatus]